MRGSYYNDPFTAEWLRGLIAARLLPAGDVDERSIVDVHPDDLIGYRHCHLFAGIGGWAHAAQLAGWPEDRELYTGSCPCQPFSLASTKRKLDKDPRDLWPDFLRIIAARRPNVAVGEQVAKATGYAWFDRVQSDLAKTGYASRGVDIPAACVDAPHRRSRLYWVAMADPGRERRQQVSSGAPSDQVPHEGLEGQVGAPDGDHVAERSAESPGSMESPRPNGSWWGDAEWLECADGKRRRAKPGIPGMVIGLPGRVDILRGFGNAIVPQVGAEVLRALMDVTDP